MFARILSTLAFVLFVFTSAFNSTAQAAGHVGPRYDWFYGKNYFHAVQGGGGAWVETIDAREAYYFQQTDRNDAYVELYDSSRDVHVRLYPTVMYFKGPGDAQFRYFRDGQWDDRRLYSYAPTSYFNLRTAEIWVWARPGQQTLYMREILRNESQVQLYNGAEGVTISLLDGQVWIKHDGGEWSKFSDGSWGL